MIDVAFLIDLSPRCRFRHFSENRSRRVCGLIRGLDGWVSAMPDEGSLMWAGLAGVVPGSEVAVRFRGDAGWPTSSDEDEADWLAGAPPGCGRGRRRTYYRLTPKGCCTALCELTTPRKRQNSEKPEATNLRETAPSAQGSHDQDDRKEENLH